MTVTISNIATGDTLETGRGVVNTNFNNCKVAVEADVTALATHKSADDHAATYSVLAHTHNTYALDSAVVHNTGNEAVAGAKAFSSDPVIKTGNTSLVDMRTAADSPMGRVRSAITGTDDRVVALDAWSVVGNNYISMIQGVADEGSVDTPVADLYSRGHKVATEEYVQARIRSGTFIIPFSKNIDSLAASTTYTFNNAEAHPVAVIPPIGATIKDLIFAFSYADISWGHNIHTEAVGYNTPMNAEGVLELEFSTSADSSGVVYTFTIYRCTQGGGSRASVWTITSTTMGLPKLDISVEYRINASLVMTY